MTRKQRVGLESSATRTALLDAAQSLMLEEGYAAVTSRRLGARADVRPQLVHYYFRTMDDLFLALLRRTAELGLEAAEQALKSDQPLRVLWAQSRDPSAAVLSAELMALANHRKAFRGEMAKFGDRLRVLQERAVARHFEQRGIDLRIPPGALTLLIASVGLTLMMESAVGMTRGHAETEALVDACLRDLEAGSGALVRGPPQPRRPPRKADPARRPRRPD